ncbi:MAG: ROK family transcriptional regulator [Pseudomonadota bacterium]
MDGSKIRALSSGVNQSGLRNHNERLLLSMLQRNGPMPGSDLARIAELSPQTVSVILRKLEKDGLLVKGAPVRGKVGKPSIPMELNADGVFALGANIGRRSAKAVLMDFKGQVRAESSIRFDYPLPDEIFAFLRSAIEDLSGSLPQASRERICGIGIAAPFELWNWHEMVGAPADEFQLWKDVRFQDQLAEMTDLPVHVVNDATAACRAEHVYGRGKEFRDYAYFFVAAFVGGGVVLNHSVYEGNQGNAGALGSLRSVGPNGESRQLIDIASIHLLEARLAEVGLDASVLWKTEDWSAYDRYVEPWIRQTAQELAKAALSTCAVIDFEAILIDGGIPTGVKHTLVDRTRRYISNQDTRGLIRPQIEAGEMGRSAREIGAACSPIWSEFLLKTNAGLT